MVIGILSIAMSFLMKFNNSFKKTSLKQAVEEINEILLKAYNNSILTGSIYQVRFFFDEKQIITNIGISPVSKIENVAQTQIPTSDIIKIKSTLLAKKFMINGKDELSSSNTKEIWILSFPEGFMQEANIYFYHPESENGGEYFINPFYGAILEKDFDEK